MNFRSRSRSIINTSVTHLGSLVLGFLIVCVLQVTGVMNSVSYVSQLALLNSGLRDATAKKDPESTAFDYEFTIKDLQGTRLPFDQFSLLEDVKPQWGLVPEDALMVGVDGLAVVIVDVSKQLLVAENFVLGHAHETRHRLPRGQAHVPTPQQVAEGQVAQVHALLDKFGQQRQRVNQLRVDSVRALCDLQV